MAGIFGKTPLESPWKELFADIVKLNEFTQQNRKVQVHDALIENYDISGANLRAAVFEKTEWKNVIAKKIIMDKAVFRNSKFEKVSFAGASFSGVLFENSEFIDVEFDEAQLSDVRFVSCKFKGTDFWKLQHSKIKFDHARIEKSQFNDSSAELAFANSTLNDVDMRSLQAPSALNFEKSELKEVNFSDSHLSNFSLSSVNADKYGFEGGTVDKVDIRDSYLGIGMREVQIGSLTIARSKIESRFTLSKIDHVDISNCQAVIDLGFYKSTVGTLSIRECALENFRAIGATITTMKIKDSQLRNNEFKNLKAGTVIFENVTLDQKIDFTNAQIDTLNVKGLVKLPSLNLITTGSNIKLD